MKRKWLVALAIAVLVAIVVIVGVAHHGKNALGVTVDKVVTRTVQSSILASGQFAYKDQVVLRPQVDGQIVSLAVAAGDKVKQGDVVLRIDPKTYQANVAEQQAQAALQRYAISQAQLRLDNLKLQWERNTKLYKKGLIDANSYDELTNQYHLAQVAVSSSRESLSVAAAQLQFAQEQLAKTVVRAPLSGIVIALNVKVGESVIPGTTNIPGSSLMTIGDPSELLAEVNVDEADIAHASLGETAAVTSTAYPNDTLHGQVTFVAPAATTMPGQQGQGFLVKIRLPNPHGLAIRPNMTCRAEIYTQSAKDTLAVPVGAVLFANQIKPSKALFSDQGAYVFVDDGGTAKRQDVTLGISSDTWQEIKSGLKAGQQVITGPYEVLHALAAGASVSVQTPAPIPQSG
ncbi:MAG: efflux RND transporter periplasmic adaptor subunit [Gammaproteobacteria bacterium]